MIFIVIVAFIAGAIAGYKGHDRIKDIEDRLKK